MATRPSAAQTILAAAATAAASGQPDGVAGVPWVWSDREVAVARVPPARVAATFQPAPGGAEILRRKGFVAA